MSLGGRKDTGRHAFAVFSLFLSLVEADSRRNPSVRIYAQERTKSDATKLPLFPSPSICPFVEGRSIDSFISHAINKREEAWCINFRASKRNLASRIEFKSKPS